jgi:hypothetical protein
MNPVRIALFGLLLALAGLVAAAPPAPTESQSKAAYLLHFARFAIWPESVLPEDEPIDICVLGRDPFGDVLKGAESRLAQDHPIRVHYLESVGEAFACDVLFVSSSEQRRLNAILRELAGAPILTVSDIEGFVESGGAIGMLTQDDKVRFDVNLEALESHGLRMSSNALSVARRLLGEKRH